MNGVDLLLIALLAAAVGLAVFLLIRHGRRGCGGNCDSCGGCRRN